VRRGRPQRRGNIGVIFSGEFHDDRRRALTISSAGDNGRKIPVSYAGAVRAGGDSASDRKCAAMRRDCAARSLWLRGERGGGGDSAVTNAGTDGDGASRGGGGEGEIDRRGFVRRNPS